TWEFDNDHTVTLKFTASGDESKDEFYKSGDIMTMFALYGYDKDEAEPVIALTGTDQKHITQFAKKSAANVYRTTPEAIGETTPIVLAKSTGGNPELGFDASGTAYAGDPAALVDGDTVYMYVGHDTATNESYVMPEWLCYSSKNMTDWTYEGVVMKATNISWRSNDTSAWASQCVKYGDKYYLYYCTWDKTASGKQSIGVAVSDSPTGPFTDPLGKPLVSGSFTTPESNSHDDIDPTVLIDTVDGVEHRYLAWGNTRYYVCELNEDMTSVKDIDGDGEIVMHKDIKEKKIKSLNGNVYTEAPWLYKRADKYYLFFAANWREEMAYAMTDNPFTGRYDYIQTIMPPTATSNTNHPAVIDFGDKTYFIYHNGALLHGSGFRRSVCIDELEFDDDGYVKPLTETSIGLDGTASVIKTSDNKYLGHSAFRNPLGDGSYPLSVPVTISNAENEYTTAWEIKPAKAVPQGENADNYVSIQSVDKPGLYISVSDGKVTLTQDADGKQGTNMTFKTVRGLDGNNGSVSFESVSEPGKFLTVLNKSLTVSYGNVAADATFTIDTATTKPNSVVSVAEREADPTPAEDLTQDFNSAATGSLIHLATTDTPAYTALSGVTLYIGTRGSGQDTSQNFSIASGGVTGNALVLSAGNYQSASRGGRMAINTPAIPSGYTVTAEIKVKQGVSGSVLRFNDSTTSEAGTTINGLSNTEWKTFKVAITNNEDTYTRTIMLGDTVLATDYVDTFPVLWGTTDNKTGQSIYFDDLTIKTTANE
ncbi:MAG: family 43 glycosylhydrolase, partial [Clostridia bacterium]|nr:family 43 glycosylhydrolase [Clostridia bacterium]